jgi:hypothetical protein
MILEYMLIREAGAKRAPSWVEDGGYFSNPDNNTIVGWSPDLADRDYYVPDSVTELTRAELKTRVRGIDANYPMLDDEENELSDSAIDALVDAWWDDHGEP